MSLPFEEERPAHRKIARGHAPMSCLSLNFLRGFSCSLPADWRQPPKHLPIPRAASCPRGFASSRPVCGIHRRTERKAQPCSLYSTLLKAITRNYPSSLIGQYGHACLLLASALAKVIEQTKPSGKNCGSNVPESARVHT